MKRALGGMIGLALVLATPAMVLGQETASPPHPIQTPAPPSQPPSLSSALEPGEGRVVLNCGVQQDGSVTDCRVESEEPAGQGFGPAALRVAAQTRLSEEQARRAGIGARVRWTTRFRLDD
ncbi:energy transducer TonB [Brevundimonas sp. M20]|uniref:energy transducer TonB n=1 Tax=Brevundimonas sp. M20 TaxID=2591463 RepID=UPI0011478D58|nr:energy transducer TonB [Brevundimonas sp. M20]QDH72409.1 hypothetical protein FKQ52_02575 [Brevundimonas sp. M20]